MTVAAMLSNTSDLTPYLDSVRKARADAINKKFDEIGRAHV